MIYSDHAELLEQLVGFEVAANYRTLLQSLKHPVLEFSNEKTAVLIIDPQHSFTGGLWKYSIGPQADFEVKPICQAFENCAIFLKEYYRKMEIRFTRCPFPGASYDWDQRVRDLIDPEQPYFHKPGNSVLWPPNNGFREWIENLLAQGKQNLVIGGCTLNSCVRVSAIETQTFFKQQGLQVMVNLSLAGARTRNFIASPFYGGLSSVESAIQQMQSAGVIVGNE